MIISKAPLRIPLGGGGTDLPSFYKKYGGFLISGAINKHSYVSISKYFFNSYSLKYSKIEITDDLSLIEHNLIREALKLVGIPPGVEITSLADIPSGTGLGSSGAFLVSLLNSLYEYKNQTTSKRQLAEDACKIELDILKEHEGKQDKYACSFGGIKAYRFNRDGSVSVIPLANEDVIMSELQNKLYLFFTGQRRQVKASEVLKRQDVETKKGNEAIITSLIQIKVIGETTKKALENQDFDKFGRLLNEHWQIKKQYSPTSTSDFIDTCYNVAMDNGALGGKVMGAGGGGFLMFYHPGEGKEIWPFFEEMQKLGLQHMKFSFDKTGVTTITRGDENVGQ